MRVNVLHPITRLIIGGAQENTMLTAALMNQAPAYQDRYAVGVVSGVQTGPEGSLIEEVRRRAVPLFLMPELRRELNPPLDWRAFRKLTHLMRGAGPRTKYPIVHTHSSKAGVLGRLAARQAGVPVIVHTVHGWSFHDQMSARRRRFYIGLERLAARISQAMIVVTSRDMEKGLTEGIGRPQDYVLIRSGIELDRFGHPRVPAVAMRAQLGIPAEVPVVGSVTRLSPQKAPGDLVEALAHIGHRHPQAWFVIVGDGPLRAETEARLRQVGIADRTVLTGLRRDVPELMATFDIFVLSSLWEGLPRVLPQAMATGLPIVCTQADGSAEAVIDGENGFLVPRSEPAALAARAVLLLETPELRRRMGTEGRRRAPEFSAEKMVHEIDNLYQRLLAQRTLSR